MSRDANAPASAESSSELMSMTPGNSAQTLRGVLSATKTESASEETQSNVGAAHGSLVPSG